MNDEEHVQYKANISKVHLCLCSQRFLCFHSFCFCWYIFVLWFISIRIGSGWGRVNYIHNFFSWYKQNPVSRLSSVQFISFLHGINFSQSGRLLFPLDWRLNFQNISHINLHITLFMIINLQHPPQSYYDIKLCSSLASLIVIAVLSLRYVESIWYTAYLNLIKW